MNSCSFETFAIYFLFMDVCLRVFCAPELVFFCILAGLDPSVVILFHVDVHLVEGMLPGKEILVSIRNLGEAEKPDNALLPFRKCCTIAAVSSSDVQTEL